MSVTAFYALSDEERDYWIADWELRRLECPDCHGTLTECSDPERTHYPYRRICYATMEREAATEAYQELHKDRPWHDGTFRSWTANRSGSHPYPAGAGVSFGIADRDLAPWDKFTTDENASPVRLPQAEDQEQPAESDDGRQAGEGHRVPEAALPESEGDD